MVLLRRRSTGNRCSRTASLDRLLGSLLIPSGTLLSFRLLEVGPQLQIDLKCVFLQAGNMLLKAVVKIIIFPSQPYRKLQPTELMTEAGVDFSFRCLNLQPHSCQSPDCVQKFTRYFTNQEISQLFELGSTSESETCSQLEQLHGADRNHSDQVKSDISAIAEMG